MRGDFAVTVSSVIMREFENAPENITENCPCTLDRVGNRIVLSYESGGENERSLTEIEFYAASPSRVTVRRRGAFSAEAVYEKEYFSSFLYTAGGYAFDSAVYTESLFNSLGEDGGRLSIVYVMDVGGVKSRVNMNIICKRG